MTSPLKKTALKLFLLAAGFVFLYGCSFQKTLAELIDDSKSDTLTEIKKNPSDYYNKFFIEMTKRASMKKGTTDIIALDSLPKDSEGEVNWTTAVVLGYISPRPSLDPNAEDDPPFNLNIFIEAKTPLMANVMFPHSIHTYWLSCNNCHPNIFIPEAGANPITMDEIFKGEWCGRCHGKVAFTFWPKANCNRCHIMLKGESLERETFR